MPARGGFTQGKTWWPKLYPWLLLAALVVVLDQLSKLVIERVFNYGDSRPVTSFFNLVLTYNEGAAFSFLAGAGGWQRHFFTVVGVGASIFIAVLLARHGTQKLFSTALALIMGGAIGNVIDRVAYGHVIDFLDFHAKGWHWPAFNVADMAIVSGAVLLVLDELLRVKKSR
ncbi:MAG: signal peptidase II [Burkholderiaceae bacterium]